MRKEAIPSLVVCIGVSAALSLTLSDDFHHSLIVASVKVFGILSLLALGMTLAFDKKRPASELANIAAGN
jgi:hypothetical protein